MISWSCKKFEDLTPHELYAILQLRNEVFVVEQNCVYQDADNKDQSSRHFMGWMQEKDKPAKLVAYTRLVPPGQAYPLPSIGRVVTSPAIRKTGVGKELMRKSIAQVYEFYGNTSIQIGAQLYLKKFYESLGFAQSSNPYFEDGIEHIEMILHPANSNSTK
jgi:ElaA protein